MRSAARILEVSEPIIGFEVQPVRAFSYALQHKLNALMVAAHPTTTAYIWFVRGRLTELHLEPSPLCLIDALTPLDGVDRITLQMLAPGAPSDDVLAQELLDAGAVDAETMAEARMAQSLVGLDVLFALRDSVAVSIYADDSADGTARSVPPALVFMRAARLAENFGLVDGYIQRLADSPLSVHEMSNLRGCEMSADELRVARLLQDMPSTVQGLLDAGAARRDVHAVVFAMSMAGEMVRASQPSIRSRPSDAVPISARRPSTSVSAPPSSPSIRSAPSSIRSGPSSVRGMPFRRSKAPRAERVSRHPAPESDRMMRAKQTNVAVKFALESFKAAERALGMNQFTLAAEHVTRALGYDADNLTYQAFAAFVAVADRRSKTADLQKGLKDLGRILVHDSNNASAHYFRGRILKRLKKRESARDAFKRAAELDPSNLHAVEEALKPVVSRKSR